MRDQRISSMALLLMSVSAIMGSGWLFSSFYTTEIAGPSSLVSWVIACVFILIVAFPFSEIFSMLPMSGISVRLPQLTHGKIIGVFCSLSILFTYIGMVVISVQSVVQYLCFYFPTLMGKDGLSKSGYITAACLLLAVCVVNATSMRWVSKSNTILTLIKFIVPIFIGLLLIVVAFSLTNIIHPVNSSFATNGVHGIFSAISTGGIIFCFAGFQFSCEMGGETKRPDRAIPLAIFGSVLLCTLLFLILQVGFLMALSPSDIKLGFGELTLVNNNAPFVSLLSEHHIGWAIYILYAGAIISPMAAALVYCTCSGRALLAIAANGYAPTILLKQNRHGTPFITIWVSFVLSLIVITFFNNWKVLSQLLTYLFATAFIFAPVCLLSLRRQLPKVKRCIRLPFAKIWCFISFYFGILFIYWVGWNVVSKMLYLILASIAAGILVQIFSKDGVKKVFLQWRNSLWLWFSLFSVSLVSYVGNFDGGKNLFSMTTIMILLGVIAFITLVLSLVFNEKTEDIRHSLEKAHLWKSESESK